MVVSTTIEISDPALAAMRRHMYEAEFGFCCEIDNNHLITLRTGRAFGVQALWMPNSFAAQLFRALPTPGLNVPMFSVPLERRWFLLVQPPVNSKRRPWCSDPEFIACDVKSFPAVRLSLPTPGRGERVWMNPPQGRQLAPFEDVEDAIRAVARKTDRGMVYR